MNPLQQYQQQLARRHFFSRSALGLGAAALASLLPQSSDAASPAGGGLQGLPHFAPTAKRVIFLFQSGAPSQIDTFDYKPRLQQLQGTDLPDSIRKGQRLTGMTANQKKFPVAASIFPFKQHGQAGTWLSSLLPYTGGVVDELCVVKSMFTEAINHDPAITLMQTGSQQPGRASMGAWISYGLGTENEELPAFTVLVSHTKGKPNPQGLLSRLWTAGFLPSQHQGVKFRAGGDPVLYLSDPPGIDRTMRRDMLDRIARLNVLQQQALGDPEIATRIAQYEMAFRMQTSVPELTDLSGETAATFNLYGPDARQPGTFAANCLLARRLAERGVRFIQLYHRGWDQHGNLPKQISVLCRETDQPAAALIMDLKRRGMLDDTLVVWGGEFGRTVYCQGKLTKNNYGRDHHPRCFSVWLAGGGIRGGMSHGASDDFSYNISRDPVHVHDLQATVLHCLGIRHTQLTFKYQGRHHRLTDVHGKVVRRIIA
ncbi:MAG: DUF1501 domain-containing protein [Planctomycetes bacterium]|nr:DUF1501 domain-containing protein [Planctomycetota bacterium]